MGDTWTVKEIRGLIGECDVPGNPDLTLMAMALSAKARGESIIRHGSQRPEVKPLIEALAHLGVGVGVSDTEMKIAGGSIKSAEGQIDVGDSPLLLGCLAGLTAGAEFRTRFTGRANAQGVVDALKTLGAFVDTPFDGVFPLAVGGRGIKAGTVKIDMPDTTVKTAFFLAGVDAPGEVKLLQPSAGDDDFEVLLKASGVGLEKIKEVGKEGYLLFLTGPQIVQPTLHDLAGDPDAALYLLGTGAMLSQTNLAVHYVGNDWKTRRLLELLRRFNAQIDIQVARSLSKMSIRTVTVKKSELRRTRIAGEQTALFLNEVPFLAVLGTQAVGETVIRDAQKLREGPVDRLMLITENLRRMGAKVGEMPDGLVVQGPVRLQGAELDAKGDVRVGIALSLAGLVAEGDSVIVNVGSMASDFASLFQTVASVANEKRVYHETAL